MLLRNIINKKTSHYLQLLWLLDAKDIDLHRFFKETMTHRHSIESICFLWLAWKSMQDSFHTSTTSFDELFAQILLCLFSFTVVFVYGLDYFSLKTYFRFPLENLHILATEWVLQRAEMLRDCYFPQDYPRTFGFLSLQKWT